VQVISDDSLSDDDNFRDAERVYDINMGNEWFEWVTYENSSAILCGARCHRRNKETDEALLRIKSEARMEALHSGRVPTFHSPYQVLTKLYRARIAQ